MHINVQVFFYGGESMEKFDKRFMKDFALKMQGLDKLPVKLTINDLNGVNKSVTTQRKFEKYFEYMARRKEFEENWTMWNEEWSDGNG